MIARILIAFALLVIAAGAAGTPGSAQEQKSREFQECPDCPQMVAVPAGRFAMGSPANEHGRFENEGPQHYVSIRAFAIGKYDVTSEQFRQFLQETGYHPAPCNRILDLGWHRGAEGRVYPPDEVEPHRWPAVCLDWRDAQAYVDWLNAKVKAVHPSLAARKGPYRLPSEAEWEYAARGGTTTARWWGEDIGTDNANCNGCGSKWDDKLFSIVDSFRPNPFGLYGVLGNAWQWTADCWHKSYVGAPSDGRPWTEGDCSKHVIRGGSWDNLPVFVRSASRSGAGPDGGEYDYSSFAGFRVARDLP